MKDCCRIEQSDKVELSEQDRETDSEKFSFKKAFWEVR